jgi:hypothetical protein
MKLKLPVTLVAVDCVKPTETLKTIVYTLRSVEFDKVVLVTGPPGHIGVEFEDAGVTVIQSVQGGRLDYEDFVLRKLVTCFDSSHCLFMEWDSGVLNPAAWVTE